MTEKKILFSITAKDFRVDTYIAGGPGGQHRNKTSSAVRITHMESGATGDCSNYRSQHENKAEAFKRLVASDKFKLWHRKKTAEILLKEQGMLSIEEQVERAMNPKNITVEHKDERGRWVEGEPTDGDI